MQQKDCNLEILTLCYLILTYYHSIAVVAIGANVTQMIGRLYETERRDPVMFSR